MFDHKQYRQQFVENHKAGNSPVNDAVAYDVRIESVSHEEGEFYWKIIGIHHLVPLENGGKHNLFMDVLDTVGNRVEPFFEVDWDWEGRRPDENAPPVRLDKPDNEPGGNLSMWINQTISAWVTDDDEQSDAIVNVHTRHKDEPIGNSIGHHSFYVVWMLVEMGQEPDPEPPLPEPEPENDAEELLQQIYDLITVYFEDKT